MLKRIFPLLILVCSLGGSTPLLQAQGEGAIHGAVLAKADGSAILSATVRLEGVTVNLSWTTTTGGDGHFGFQRLVPGEYILTARHPNFIERQVQFTLKPREGLNLTLEMELEQVRETVEVTAEAIPIAPTYSPSSTVLQAQSVETLPLPQRSNLTDIMVATAPGMIRGHDDFV
ncbi:MAG: carboxypeptidase regulatory-like domain-containing protein, partial [Acidobacteria bacterium]|nr:carboxypeptidase regulatory-like domain-containing protein [Acidobacteriota bacterium]